MVVKRVAIISAIVGAVILAVVSAGVGVGMWLSPQSHLARVDAIVAISGGETDSRARTAIKLYQDGYAPKIIFSGAALDRLGPSNAVQMRRLAEDADVKTSDIIIDETATNTSQNASAVTKIIRDHNYHKIILVTSPYHQRRAFISFSRNLGTDVAIINHSAFDQNWRRSRWWLTPSAYPITMSEIQKTGFLLVTGSK